MLSQDDLLTWLREQARKYDDLAHDMSSGHSRNADFNRTCAWMRAVSFYEVIVKLTGTTDPGGLMPEKE